MPSETDSSEWSVNLKLQKLKKSSNKKSKKHKKDKKHKSKKKRKHSSSSSEEERATIPTIPTQIYDNGNTNTEEGSFGPALPPHLLQKIPDNATDASQSHMIGPVLPSNEIPKSTDGSKHSFSGDPVEETGSDDEMGVFGPLPQTNEGKQVMTDAQIKLEERALELKLAGLGGSKHADDEQEGREEWMLELPEVGLKGGLAALSNMKRTFHQGKERPDFSDRSSWTQTPQDAGKPPKAAKCVETLQQKAQVNFERERDKEQERLARKHKRAAPLVEQHQKKLKKEQRQKEKELLVSGGKTERRPFTRDVDLKLNKIDKNQTKQIVDKAKILDSKFSSGHTKYL